MSFVLNCLPLLLNFLTVLVDNIPKFLYFLITNILSILDLFQFLFRRFAGLDVYYIDGVEQEGDIILGFMRGIVEGKYPALRTIMISLIILGTILLVLSTILAVIKTELNPDGRDERGQFKVGNKKGKAIGNMFKGFFMMFIIPTCCIFGIALANVVLRAVDTATLTTTNSSILASYTFTDDNNNVKSVFKEHDGSYSNYDLFGNITPAKYTTFSGMIFKVSVNDANRARTNSEFVNTVILAEDTLSGYSGNFGVFNLPTNDYDIAELIDVAFANNAELNNSYSGAKMDLNKGVASDYMQTAGNFFALGFNDPVTNFSKSNIGLVTYYYNLWMYNWVIAIAFTYFITMFYLKITFGLIKRLITLLALFITSPIFCSTLPLKDFSAGLKKDLISNTISVIAYVGSMNIFMSLLPYLESITFFAPGIGYDLINQIIQLLFVVCGFGMIESIISMINGYLGGGNLDGGDLASKSLDTITKSGKIAAKTVAAGVTGGATAIGSIAAAGGAAIAGGAKNFWRNNIMSEEVNGTRTFGGDRRALRLNSRERKQQMQSLKKEQRQELKEHDNVSSWLQKSGKEEGSRSNEKKYLEYLYSNYRQGGGTQEYSSWLKNNSEAQEAKQNFETIRSRNKISKQRNAEIRKDILKKHKSDLQNRKNQYNEIKENIKQGQKQRKGETKDKIAKNLKKFGSGALNVLSSGEHIAGNAFKGVSKTLNIESKDKK